MVHCGGGAPWVPQNVFFEAQVGLHVGGPSWPIIHFEYMEPNLASKITIYKVQVGAHLGTLVGGQDGKLEKTWVGDSVGAPAPGADPGTP